VVDAPGAKPQAGDLSGPLCGDHLPALSEHILIAPEGDMARRRHAHTDCVIAARKDGRLPTKDEWRKTQPRAPSILETDQSEALMLQFLAVAAAGAAAGASNAPRRRRLVDQPSQPWWHLASHRSQPT